MVLVRYMYLVLISDEERLDLLWGHYYHYDDDEDDDIY